MIKVISYCLFGQSPKYCVGAIRNAELAKEVYPEWEPWFFCGTSVPTQILLNIENTNKKARIILMDKSGGHEMMLDRLRPSLDDDVECFISRDTDSRFSKREKFAVDEWLASDKTWHTMHAHFWHSVPILGGMFGVKKRGFTNLWNLAENWQKSTEARWQQDQDFLTQVIWPKIKDDVLNHADFHTNIWPGKSFPVPMEPGHFIGATYDENNKIDKLQLERLYG